MRYMLITCMLVGLGMCAAEERGEDTEELVAKIVMYLEHPNPVVELTDGELLLLFDKPALVNSIKKKGVRVLRELARIAIANPRLTKVAVLLYIDLGMDFARDDKASEKRPSELIFLGERIVSIFGTGHALIRSTPASLRDGQAEEMVQAATRWLEETYPSFYGNNRNVLRAAGESPHTQPPSPPPALPDP